MSTWQAPRLLAPLRESAFRWLWASMAVSFVGDRLQELAQGWLVATLTSSAVAVGAIGIVSAIPQLLMPVGGVVADQVNRRRLVVGCQLVGGAAAAVVGILVLLGRVELWHIYAWAFVAGVIWLLTRPAFKVMLTGSVPPDEVPAAAALNSLTETTAVVVVSSAGSVLLTVLGLPFAFLLNAASYIAAALGLRTRAVVDADAEDLPGRSRNGLLGRRILPDLVNGLRYLGHRRDLLVPLLSTLAIMIATMPAVGLLPAIVHREGGSLVQVGLLAAAGSAGSMVGAIYAGAARPRRSVRVRYLALGLVAAASLVLFSALPFGYTLSVPLAVIGFALFSEAVWNTSRVRQAAAPQFQARLQALTTMAFTLGSMLGLLWGGPAIDAFGVGALRAAAAALAVVVAALALVPHQGDLVETVH